MPILYLLLYDIGFFFLSRSHRLTDTSQQSRKRLNILTFVYPSVPPTYDPQHHRKRRNLKRHTAAKAPLSLAFFYPFVSSFSIALQSDFTVLLCDISAFKITKSQTAVKTVGIEVDRSTTIKLLSDHNSHRLIS